MAAGGGSRRKTGALARFSRSLPRFTAPTTFVLLHDLVMTAIAVLAAFYIRFEQAGIVARLDYLWVVLPLFVAYAGVIYVLSQLYRSKWRFASLPDLVYIFRAALILAVSMLALDYILLASYLYGDFFFGKITIVLYFCLQILLLGGPRIAYRYIRYARSRQQIGQAERAPALLLGTPAEAEVLLRSIENGAVGRIRASGILSPVAADTGLVLRGVEVLGTTTDVERAVAEFEARGIRVARLILLPSALAADARPEEALMQARRLGIVVSRLPTLEPGEPVRFAPIDVEDLLLRPSVSIDHDSALRVVAGKSVIVTGGGGSIGSELCQRVVSFGAARLLVVENSEPALHAIMESLAARQSHCAISGRIADVRDRDRIHRLFAQFEPDLVFHAAALKHVPIVELDWAEGVKTNVFGTINVADAAHIVGAESMILISTDKAIEPLSMLGATKRFAELYCQALDAEFAARPARHGGRARMIAVRFGNVLGSNGSVVPKFKAQIEAGGPVTLTHPDMVRYFMTIREACDLVVAATGHAIAGREPEGLSVYVLNMGQPVRIADLAEHMIRLHGLEPNVDIDIVFTGVRPGERIEEILFARDEQHLETGIPGIVAATSGAPAMESLRRWLAALREAIAHDDRAAVYRTLAAAVPDFRGKAA
ncbi:MAG: polysaccharide biosynthesis protein [Bauldia sp.]|nr:polysaccharide biosynthesis protein [Bauldia sp.]